MKIDVPYFSQIKDIADDTWKRHGCSITNLKMVLEYHARILKDLQMTGSVPGIDALIDEGTAIGAYQYSVGWTHEGIVRLARNHGLPAYAQEFRSMDIDPVSGQAVPSDRLVDVGIAKLMESVERGHPVIVSVLPGFGDNKTLHTVTLSGVEREQNGFYVHDPVDPSSQTHRFVAVDEFKKYWRRLAIFFD